MMEKDVKDYVVRAYSIEELKKEFDLDGNTLMLGPGHRDSERYYEVKDARVRDAIKGVVRDFGHPCAITVEKDGCEYWLNDAPTSAGPGSTVILLFNVAYGGPLDGSSFHVATWNCGRGALTRYCYDQWLVEKPGSVMPRRYYDRTVDDVFNS